jgi:hypothetical protein
MSELDLDQPYRKGTVGPKVKPIQEWLTLSGFGVQVDGDFGSATQTAVKAFQTKAKLPATGVVDLATWRRLTAPLRAALKPIPVNGKTVGQLTIACAQQHLKQRPREVGGANCGPWVRLYMDGWEGATAYWCAGFATYCMRQACETLNLPMPLVRSTGVREIADYARQHGVFLDKPQGTTRRRITPGSLFMEEGGPTGYQHTGLVTGLAAGGVFYTIEGNSNDDGSSNGYEVIARTRAFGSIIDFALVG